MFKRRIHPVQQTMVKYNTSKHLRNPDKARRGRWNKTERQRLALAVSGNPEASNGVLASLVGTRNARQVRDRLRSISEGKRPTPSEDERKKMRKKMREEMKERMFSGYRVVEKEVKWVEVKREFKSASYQSRGKIVKRHGNGTYDVQLDDGEIHPELEEKVIQKLSGTRRTSEAVFDNSVLRLGDRVECRVVVEASVRNTAWYHPTTGHVMWNCPQPCARKCNVLESVYPVAKSVKALAQRSEVITTENEPGKFKR